MSERTFSDLSALTGATPKKSQPAATGQSWPGTKERVTFSMAPTMKDEINNAAHTLGLSSSALVRELLGNSLIKLRETLNEGKPFAQASPEDDPLVELRRALNGS